MELKHYLAILLRRWVIIVGVPAIVLIAVIMQMATYEPVYTASAQLSVTRTPQQIDIEAFRFNEYYLYLASEFAIDDLVEVVRGNVFARGVHETILQNEGIDVSPGEIQTAIVSDRRHRILRIDVESDDPERAVLIARSAALTLEEDALRFVGFELDERSAVVSIVHLPEDAESSQNRERLIWMMQLLIAAFAGVLLAFLYDSFDDSLHNEEMVREALGVDVIASIPGERRW
jgi:capsular polysaccharide biosynthesis protein